MTATRTSLASLPSSTDASTRSAAPGSLARLALSLGRGLGTMASAISTMATRGQLGPSPDKSAGRRTGARV